MKQAKLSSPRTAIQTRVASFLLVGTFCFLGSAAQAEPAPHQAEKTRSVKRSPATNPQRDFAVRINVNKAQQGTAVGNSRQVRARRLRLFKKNRPVASAPEQPKTQEKKGVSISRSETGLRLLLNTQEDETVEILLPQGIKRRR